MNQQDNGCYTANSSREEGWKEEERQMRLQRQEGTSGGSTFGKERIIHLENTASKEGPFLIHCSTTDHIIQYLQSVLPNVKTEKIGFRIYTKRMGAIGRQIVEGMLDETVEELWVSLYLRKH
jgi:hypothetical protein